MEAESTTVMRPDPGSNLDCAPGGPLDAEHAAGGVGNGPNFDLVVADASWTWTERLFAPLSDLGQRVLLIKAVDWRTALNQRRPGREWLWPSEQLGPNLWVRHFILPPGWMKSYPRLGMRPIARAIASWRQSLPQPRPLALALSYPHYLHLRDLVRPDALVYYNMDDYALYWRSRAEQVRRLERQVVREADLSLFCARIRSEELAASEPEARDRIVHLPHGAPSASIAPSPLRTAAPAPPDLAAMPGPRLGFVGSLEDRLDWDLLGQTARAFPHGSVVLIGREPAEAPREPWYQSYQRTIALPNVYRLGWKSQAELGRYMSAFDVCLIPYRTDHAFNRVSCPTKLMDYMATSRPVVTTSLPECQLYRHLFDVAETPDEFVTAVQRIVERAGDDGRAERRWYAARSATWERTSERLLRLLRARLPA